MSDNQGIIITGVKDKLLTELSENMNKDFNGKNSYKLEVLSKPAVDLKNATLNDISMDKIIVYGSAKDNLSLMDCEKLILLSKKTEVNILSYSDEYELLFKLGSMMDKSSCYAVSENSRKVLKPLLATALADEYKLYQISLKASSSTPVTRNRRKKSEIEAEKNMTSAEKLEPEPAKKTDNFNKPVSKEFKDVKTFESFGNSEKSGNEMVNKIKTTESADVKIETKASVDMKPSEQTGNSEKLEKKYKKISSVENELKNINKIPENNILIDKPEKTEIKADINNTVTSKNSKNSEVGDGEFKELEETEKSDERIISGYPESVIKLFLKRSGIRSNDLHDYECDDEELAVDMMKILANTYDKKTFKEKLEEKYSEKDVNYLMKWMGSNLMKLHITSCGNIE